MPKVVYLPVLITIVATFVLPALTAACYRITTLNEYWRVREACAGREYHTMLAVICLAGLCCAVVENSLANPVGIVSFVLILITNSVVVITLELYLLRKQPDGN